MYQDGPPGPEPPWAVLLAGGNGAVVRSATARIAGDARPRQFCCIHGDKNLFTQTRERLAPVFRDDRILFVVNRAHETYYRQDLGDVRERNVVAQPEDGGTGVAVASAVLQILERDSDALVAFFPCDHHYSDDGAFRTVLRGAVEFAGKHPASIILLGAEASCAETEYGWIEPGAMVGKSGALPVLRVNSFWEKPTAFEARNLFRRGCLWNTFVTAGRADTFLELLCSEAPDVVNCLSEGPYGIESEAGYGTVRPLDFSRDVLARVTDRLLVVRDASSGWEDLGDPGRALRTLLRNHIERLSLSRG